MSSSSIKKIIPCKKQQLIDMVLDIEKYPDFVPWCLEGKINEKEDHKEFTQIKAELRVGKKFLNEVYSSLVLYSKKEDKIIVTNINGPLKHLKNEWRFKEINNKTQLDFSISFELQNKFFNIIMKNYFNFGLNKITDAFEQRAVKLFK